MAGTGPGGRYDIGVYADDLAAIRAGLGLAPNTIKVPANMAKWAKARADVKDGRGSAIVAYLGDSIPAGYGTPGPATAWTNARTLAPPQRLAEELARVGITVNTQNIFGIAGANSNAEFIDYVPTVAFGAGWAGSAALASLGGKAFENSTNTNQMTFAPPLAFDTIDIYASRTGTTSIDVSVDAGAVTNLVINSGIAKYTFTAALGVHTAKFARNTGTPRLVGWNCYDASKKQVHVFNMGWAGATSAQYASTSNAAGPVAALGAVAPHLTIIQLVPNDLTAAGPTISPAQSAANLLVLINAAKASGSVLVVGFHPFEDTGGSYAIANQVAYLTAMRDVAAANGADYLSMTDRWVNFSLALANGFARASGFANELHQAAAGASDMGAVAIGQHILTA